LPSGKRGNYVIVVHGSWILASIYLCVMFRNSVCGHTHEANVILTISAHELLFRSLDFTVQKDYGFRGCMIQGTLL